MRLFAFLILAVTLGASALAGPSDELFEKLKSAPDEAEAAMPEADVLAALLESDSGATDLLMERAQIASEAGDLLLARSLLDRVIIISPDFTEGWFQRSALFLQEENYAEALRDLDEVLRLEPRHFPAWYRTGRVLQSLGSRDEAIYAFRQAVDIHPNFTAAKRSLGRLAPTTDGPSL